MTLEGFQKAFDSGAILACVQCGVLPRCGCAHVVSDFQEPDRRATALVRKPGDSTLTTIVRINGAGLPIKPDPTPHFNFD